MHDLRLTWFLWSFYIYILAIFQFSQNGTFEPVHEIQNCFWPKVFFWSIMKVPFRRNIHNMPQGPPNPGFLQEKVQKGDFQKKPPWELKFFCCFRFLWIPRRPGTLNWKQLVFLPSKNLYNQCGAPLKIQIFANFAGW